MLNEDIGKVQVRSLGMFELTGHIEPHGHLGLVILLTAKQVFLV